MENWLETICGCSIENSKLGGKGVFVNSLPFRMEIPLSETLFKPNILQMAKKNDMLLMYLTKLSELNASDKFFFVAFFLWAKSIGFWPQYIKQLPQEFCNPTNWSPNAVESLLLEGTNLDLAIAAKKASLEREYANFNVVGSSFDEFVWAEHIVQSRWMKIPDHGLCIVPFVDFCNHSLTPNAHWQVKDGIFVVVPNSELKIGDEILISYGDFPNSELLFLHGFTLENNPHDSIRLIPPFLENQSTPDYNTDDEDVEYIQEQHTVGIIDRKRALKILELDFLLEIKQACISGSEFNTSRGILSDSSLSLLYLCMLTEADGLQIEQDSVSLHDQKCTKSNFLELCTKLDSFALVSARAWTALKYSVETHIDMLAQELQDEISNLNLNVHNVEVLRNGQLDVLSNALPIIEELQLNSVEDPMVVKFLDIKL